jgi:3-hydroxyisobutyrate dehydrogenase
MNVGFVGLGSLGRAIARHLIDEGVELTVWNRTRSKAEELGVPIAESPAELISQTDTVILSLTDSAAVQAVLMGEKGLLAADCRGKIIIDTTTNHFESVLSFHQAVKESGAWYLEAPVLGSVMPASKGLLTVLVSGEEEAYEKAKPLIGKIGKTIFYLKEPTIATKMKLVNNLVLGTLMATLAEAVVLGENVGIPKEKVLEILSKGAGDSMVLNAKREKLLKEDFAVNFSSAMIYKDLHYLQDLARTMRRPLLTGSITKEIFGMAFTKGIENLDFSAIYRVFREY